MLVLSRKENECIVIDGRIKVTVVDIQGGRIRLGIEAPQDVLIRRSELPESRVAIRPFVMPKAPEPLELAP